MTIASTFVPATRNTTSYIRVRSIKTGTRCQAKNAMQVRARILIGLATFFDGFDVIAIAATLPVLIAKWHLTPWEIGFLIGSGSVGGRFLPPLPALGCKVCLAL